MDRILVPYYTCTCQFSTTWAEKQSGKVRKTIETAEKNFSVLLMETKIGMFKGSIHCFPALEWLLKDKVFPKHLGKEFLSNWLLLGLFCFKKHESGFSPRPRAKSSYFDFNTFKLIQKY